MIIQSFNTIITSFHISIVIGLLSHWFSTYVFYIYIFLGIFI